jgi:hypothetical protein
MHFDDGSIKGQEKLKPWTTVSGTRGTQNVFFGFGNKNPST